MAEAAAALATPENIKAVTPVVQSSIRFGTIIIAVIVVFFIVIIIVLVVYTNAKKTNKTQAKQTKQANKTGSKSTKQQNKQQGKQKTSKGKGTSAAGGKGKTSTPPSSSGQQRM